MWIPQVFSASIAFANIGVGVINPLMGLEVATTGSASALIVPRDNTANRPATGVNGMIRYNTTANAFEGFVNGAWMQFAQQPLGSTANVTASGPPVNANVYTVSSTSCNYSPGFGTCAQVTNGSWPANGSSTSSCLNLPADGTSTIVLDFGSNKTFGNVYSSVNGYGGYFTLGVSFSTDNVTYTSSMTGYGNGNASAYYTAVALAPNQVARYIRLTNGSGNNNGGVYEAVCQFAAGP